jgi:hypothetical protein
MLFEEADRCSYGRIYGPIRSETPHEEAELTQKSVVSLL